MSKIVKYTEFKKVVDGLWEKAKNNFVTITKSLEFVSKVNTNLISEKTTIVDGYVLGSKVSSVDNKPNQVNYMNDSDFFIYEHLKVSANTKISHITIGVNNSLNVGDIVSGVAVGFAKYKATIDTHKKTYEIVEYLVQDGKGIVHKNTDTDLTCDKAVSIVVNKEVTEDLVLIVSCEKAIWGNKDAQTTGLAYGGNVAPNVGSEVILNHGNWVGKVSIYAEGTSLNDLSNNININSSEIQNIKNNKVDRTEVGNLANQIPQLDGQGKLNATTMPDLAITSVQTVQTKQDAQNLVTSGQIQVGDVVVVVSDSNSVYMYNGANHQNLFDNNFLELSIGTGTIRELNGLRPLANGQLTINATHIKLDGQNSQTVKQEIDTLKGRVDNCVTMVNGQAPINGEVTVNAGQIRAAVNGVVNNVQHYLNVISDGLKTVNTMAVSNRNKITTLEAKKPPVQAGDIITTFKDNGEVYTVGGVTYLYCGVRKVVTRNNYPQLADALGLASSVNNFEYPYFADTRHTYDNGQRTGIKRTYICAKVV